MFALVVDDFGTTFCTKESTQRLTKSLRKNYKDLDVNWKGSKLCRIELNWDYNKYACDLMLSYFI